MTVYFPKGWWLRASEAFMCNRYSYHAFYSVDFSPELDRCVGSTSI